MVVDSIAKFLRFFTRSKESENTTMSAIIVSNNEVQSLYEIVENCLKENVSIEFACFSLKSSAHLFDVLQRFRSDSTPNEMCSSFTNNEF